MKLSIFYAEDSVTSAKIVLRLLNKAIKQYKEEYNNDIYYEIKWVKSGIEAYDEINSQKPNYFSIFLMDNNLDSGHTGMEIIKLLPSRGYDHSKIHIAAISSDLDPSNPKCSDAIAQAQDIGYRKFLPKNAGNEDIKDYIYSTFNQYFDVTSKTESTVEDSTRDVEEPNFNNTDKIKKEEKNINQLASNITTNLVDDESSLDMEEYKSRQVKSCGCFSLFTMYLHRLQKNVKIKSESSSITPKPKSVKKRIKVESESSSITPKPKSLKKCKINIKP